MLSKKDRPYETVLIETLWNVKQDTCKKPSTGFSSFNRNIVECKASQTGKNSASVSVLIETLWNVKEGGNLYLGY